ncbi:uncharacterized protein [Dendrobates tinctorius]|uniref:uncharacterized protein n=1 Tax=Dendrobates tinctorius TaxID=92724 RepID=UPI003CC9F25A
MTKGFLLSLIISVFFTVIPISTMDFRARDLTWRTQLNDVFQDKSDGECVGFNKDIQEVALKFKELLRKRTRIWWNHEFLDQYIRKDLIPRGLRIQVFPSFPVLDETFKNKWESLTNECSKGFMVLLKQLNHDSLVAIEAEIDELQSILQKEMSNDALKKLNDQIDADLQKWAQEIQTNKAKKFKRDIQDKTLSRVYRWQDPSGRSRPKFRNMSHSRSRSTSQRSNTSNYDDETGKRGSDQNTTNHMALPKRIETRQSFKNKSAGSKVPQTSSRGDLQVLNLSAHVLTRTQLEVLGKGLTFSPTNSFDYFTALKDLQLFSRKLILKKLHARSHTLEALSDVERAALSDLEDLLSEQGGPCTNLLFCTYYLPCPWICDVTVYITGLSPSSACSAYIAILDALFLIMFNVYLSLFVICFCISIHYTM